MKKSFKFLFLFFAFYAFSQIDTTVITSVSKSGNNSLNIFWAALAGCIVQEIIYWFELRHEIAKGNIPDALNSTPYWVITIVSIIIFSTVTFFYFEKLDNGSDNFFTIGTFAAGFPRLFKSAVSKVKIPPNKSPSGEDKNDPSQLIKKKGKFGLKEYLKP